MASVNTTPGVIYPSRLYLQANNFLLLGSTFQSFHRLPIVHPLINPSMDRSTDEVRILTIQHLSERSPLIGDEALDLWDTVHTQTMANIIHCKREKIYRCSKRTLQFTIYIFNKSNNLTWSRESSSLQKAESSCINKGSFFSQPS